MASWMRTGLTPARSVFHASRMSLRPSVASLPSASKLTSFWGASFHVSRQHNILPPLPQAIQGNVNDPVKVPPPSPIHGSYHWTFERIVAGSLIPLVMVPFAAGSVHPVLDGLLGALVIVHSHIGFQSCITDYFPARRTPKTDKAFRWLLNGFTAVVAYGFYELETNDVGLTEGVKRIWKA